MLNSGLIITSGNSNLTRSYQDNQPAKVATTEIIFGSPITRDCSGAGICRMVPSGKQNRFPCPSALSLVYLSSDRYLNIVLLKNTIPEVIMKKQFSGSFFQVESTFKVPKWLQLKLGSEVSLEIQPGGYSISKTGQHLSILFAL